MTCIRIATRKSPLAWWQAEHVAQALKQAHPALQVELIGMTTKGDQLLQHPLASIGGKGLFIKELEVAILEGKADIAVHSMKDIPAEGEFPTGLMLHTILQREDPLDAMVSNHFSSLAELPAKARVGTCSLRRKAQLLAKFPHLQVLDLRGNVNTRLQKLDEGAFDAILLAAAGLKRLHFASRIRQRLTDFLPAVGQGAIGIETRTDDADITHWLKPLQHAATTACVQAERTFSRVLQGGCQVPLAAFAQLQDAQMLQLQGLVATADGRRVLSDTRKGTITQAEEIGKELAQCLLRQGAAEILGQ